MSYRNGFAIAALLALAAPAFAASPSPGSSGTAPQQLLAQAGGGMTAGAPAATAQGKPGMAPASKADGGDYIGNPQPPQSAASKADGGDYIGNPQAPQSTASKADGGDYIGNPQAPQSTAKKADGGDYIGNPQPPVRR